jgi:guanine nucleotide-binding protein G(i) subunit alpha
MGGCFSLPAPEDPDARSRTHDIDRGIEDDYKKLRKEVKILLLGDSLLPHNLPKYFWHGC